MSALWMLLLGLLSVRMPNPRIVHQKPWHSLRCSADDPLGCPGESLLVENRSRAPRVARIRCGNAHEFDEQQVWLQPRSWTHVKIELPLPWKFPACRLIN